MIFSESITHDIINNIEIDYVNAVFVPDRNDKPNSAIQFNFGYLKIPAGYYFYPTFSCLIWVKITIWTSRLTLFEFGNGAFGDYVKLGLTTISNSKSFLGLSTDKNINKESVPLPDNLSIGVWHHFGLIFDSKKNGSIYLNGTLIASKQFNLKPLVVFRKENYIGKSSSITDTGGSNLVVDDLKIFNDALNQEQILEQMTSTI